MLEACLENKIIYNFLSLYDQSRWKKLIPSLIEIAILNLNSSFNTLIFSEDDIKNIIKDLKLIQKKPMFYNITPKLKEEIIFQKPSIIWRTVVLNEDDSSQNIRYYNSWKNSKKKKIYQARKIKNIDMDTNYTYDNNNLIRSYNPKEKINYAISYDKNLEPEIIERATFKRDKNKKEKKIIQKMTQEEYEQKFSKENHDNNSNIIYYKDNKGMNGYEINEVKDNDEKNYYNQLDNKIKKNLTKKNNKNIKKINFYNYKNYNNKNVNNKKIKYVNEVSNKNIRQSNNKNRNNNSKNKNSKKISNFQKITNQYFKNQNNINNILNNNNLLNSEENNKYINIENYLKNQENDNKNNNNNNNKYLSLNKNRQMNNYGTIIRDKSSDFIGIEKKYEKKIEELEKNILNKNTKKKNNKNNNNYNFDKYNIANYSNKIKANITNIDDYRKKIENNNNFINRYRNNNNNNEYIKQNQNLNNINEEDDEEEENNNIENEKNEEGIEENINEEEDDELNDDRKNEDGF